jgi:hypothetical protein
MDQGVRQILRADLFGVRHFSDLLLLDCFGLLFVDVFETDNFDIF